MSDVSPTPAVLYAAKSTNDERGSIPTQLDDCRAMADREGWPVDGEYRDEAMSAWSGDRGPGLVAAMEHAERIAPSILLVQHSDRLARGDARKARHLVEVVTWAIKADVTIRSVQDDLFADERISVLMGALMGMRNTEDSTRRSEAIKSGRRRRVEGGRAPGGTRSYGYRWEGAGTLVEVRRAGRLVVVASEAAIVRRIWDEYAAGRRLVQIVRGLYRDGVPTARGGEWAAATVAGILDNPIYVGRLRERGEEFDGEHEAIIDEATWERVRQLRATSVRRDRGRPPRGRHLFRGGMLGCGECGAAFVPRTEGSREVYVCRGRAEHGSDRCSVTATPREPIDAAVFAYFAKVGLDVEATRAQLADARDRKLVEVRTLREDAERQLTKAQEGRGRIERDYVAGELSAGNYERLAARLDEEVPAAAAEVDRLREQEADVEANAPVADAEREVLRQLTELRRAIVGEVANAEGIDAVRAALSRLFERLVLHPVGSGWSPARGDQGHVNAMIRAGRDVASVAHIELVAREAAVVGYEGITPVLRREPLGQAGNKISSGLALR